MSFRSTGLVGALCALLLVPFSLALNGCAATNEATLQHQKETGEVHHKGEDHDQIHNSPEHEELRRQHHPELY